VGRPALEVADIFRHHGAAWRKANAGHVSRIPTPKATLCGGLDTALVGDR
jgi:hypothetical protein